MKPRKKRNSFEIQIRPETRWEMGGMTAVWQIYRQGEFLREYPTLEEARRYTSKLRRGIITRKIPRRTTGYEVYSYHILHPIDVDTLQHAIGWGYYLYGYDVDVRGWASEEMAKTQAEDALRKLAAVPKTP